MRRTPNQNGSAGSSSLALSRTASRSLPAAPLRAFSRTRVEPSYPGNQLFYEYHSNEAADKTTVLFHALGAWRITPAMHDVLWNPAFFGVKPEMVIKGGFIAWSVMGDANASIPTPQPVLYRPMFGSFGAAPQSTGVTFISLASLPYVEKLGLKKRLVPVQNCRKIGKADMIHNSATPKIEVDPETYEVRADGQLLTCEPASVLPLAQRYFLF